MSLRKREHSEAKQWNIPKQTNSETRSPHSQTERHSTVSMHWPQTRHLVFLSFTVNCRPGQEVEDPWHGVPINKDTDSAWPLITIQSATLLAPWPLTGGFQSSLYKRTPNEKRLITRDTTRSCLKDEEIKGRTSMLKEGYAQSRWKQFFASYQELKIRFTMKTTNKR